MKPVADYAEEDWGNLMDLMKETVPLRVGERQAGPAHETRR